MLSVRFYRSPVQVRRCSSRPSGISESERASPACLPRGVQLLVKNFKHDTVIYDSSPSLFGL